MTRILVLGGSGGFGARIVRRLAAAGYDIIVAGRSFEKATATCGGRPGLTPAAVDRADVASALAAYRPAVLVDASGPFQVMDLAVPEACIAAGVHYVDIADSRAFVCGIGRLDGAARAAGVVALAGASSVPALSGAVVRHLARGMDRVSAVEMVISASNRATAGPSVAAAILTQVGQPFAIRRGSRWRTAFGWQSIRRVRSDCPGTAPIDGRLVALVDVPDVALLPARLPGRPAVSFRAGAELGLQTVALWLASWLVRWRLARSLRPLSVCLRPLQALLRGFGSDRSAMRVQLFGAADGQSVERRWTLIADDGCGPEIPSLAIGPAIARILSGAEPAGARDAGLALAIEDFDEPFAALSVHHAVAEFAAPPTLYERILGARFSDLPCEVRAMHTVHRDGGASGEADVAGSTNLIGALVSRFFGFPPPGRHVVEVHFEARNGRETWTRDFSGRRFTSHLSQQDDLLVERFGLLRFGFDLPSDAGGLAMVMRRWWLGPVPLPLRYAPRSLAREWAADGRFHFDVSIALPWVGRIVHYRGWLIPDSEAPRDGP